MPETTHLPFSRRPSALRYMARAFVTRHPGLARAGGFPPLAATWRGPLLGARARDEALALCGPGAAAGLPLLLPQLVGLRLQMAVLTHPSFPLPVWRSLQIRNRLHLLRPIPAESEVELTTHVDARRFLEKGAELDLRTRVLSGGALLWEGVATYYYRGRHGLPVDAPPPAAPPPVAGAPDATWQTPAGSGWRTGHLTGDYNPLHWWHGYARRAGFRGASLHPGLALARCLAHLPDPGGPAQRLDAWFRGPVYEGAGARLAAEPGPEGARFALLVEGDERPAIVGAWRAARAGEVLDGA
ncbi:MAG: MaoC family dehydratase [Deltaproteobacteria bacterium]|nr:MaoC family dehydratase [Deltaproteobacteria bacterium]